MQAKGFGGCALRNNAFKKGRGQDWDWKKEVEVQFSYQGGFSLIYREAEPIMGGRLLPEKLSCEPPASPKLRTAGGVSTSR